LNLITEADNRFLKNIEKVARREARGADDDAGSSKHIKSQAELDIIGNLELTEEEKQEMLAEEVKK
jgi:hypothetical protein